MRRLATRVAIGLAAPLALGGCADSAETYFRRTLLLNGLVL